MNKDTIQPGIYRDVPQADYFGWKLPSKSTLVYGRRSMSHMRTALDTPVVQTPDMEWGTWFHAAILEPEHFGKMQAIGPECERSRKPWKDFAEANDGKWLFKPSEAAEMTRMRMAVATHPVASAFLLGSKVNEASIVFDDPDTGVRCKCRIDSITPRAVVDYKTTKDASQRAFAADSWRRGYWLQAALYRRAFASRFGKAAPFVVVAIEKEPPYAVACYHLQGEGLRIADDELTVLLRRYRNAMESGVWPGYGEGLIPLEAPQWAAASFIGDKSEEWR